MTSSKYWKKNNIPVWHQGILIWTGHLYTELSWDVSCLVRNELPHDKTNRMACAPSKDSDQPGHLPSLIRVFAVRMKKAWVLSYPLSTQRRLWSAWASAQADLSLRWAHMPFCWFCHEVAQISNVIRKPVHAICEQQRLLHIKVRLLDY